jgi:hypothetical protein
MRYLFWDEITKGIDMSNRPVYFLIIYFLFVVNAHAESKIEKPTDTIPFMPFIAPTIIVAAPFQVKASGGDANANANASTANAFTYSVEQVASGTTVSFVSGASSGKSIPTAVGATCSKGTPIINVETSKLSERIRQTKNAICAAVGKADVRVWFSVGANGEINGEIVTVGTSTQSGIEVSFHCEGIKNKS